MNATIDSVAVPELYAPLTSLAQYFWRGAHWHSTADGPRPVREPLKNGHLHAHLNGGPRVGLAPIAPGTDTTRVAVLDFDDHDKKLDWPIMLDLAYWVGEALKERGAVPVLFRSTSGRGIHLYLTWKEPQDAYSVRQFLIEALAACKLKPGTKGARHAQIEVFPKQDSVALDGLGNMVYLPFAGQSRLLGRVTLEPLDHALAARVKEWPTSKPVPKLDRPPRNPNLSELGGDLKLLRAALDAIGNDDLPYDEWRDIIFAIHHATGGSDEGKTLAHWWSAKSGKYNAEFLDERVWPYIKNERGGSVITAQTIFNKAHAAGWQDDVVAAFEVLGPAGQDAAAVDELVATILAGSAQDAATLIAAKKLSDEVIERARQRLPGVKIERPVQEESPSAPPKNLRHEQLYAYLPEHKYIHRPTRDLWPAASVDGHIRGKRDKLRASAWLDKNRAVTQMTWWPGRDEVIEDHVIAASGWIRHPGQRVYNLYRPPLVVPGDASDVAPWLDHLRRIYSDDADHIVRWLAQRVQFPHIKLNHALVLLGDQGIGKDTILEPVKRAVGPWNWSEIAPSDVFDQFNPWVRSVVLRINESRDMGESGAVNRFVMYERTKGLCVAPPDALNCNDKHIRKFPVVNVLGVVITSNHKADCLYLPADDRRHYVASSTATKEQFTTDYWNALWGWYEREGFANVAEYLRTYDVSKFDPKAAPPKTEAFWRIVTANADPGDSALTDLLEEMGDPAVVTIEAIKAADLSRGDPVAGPRVECLSAPQAQLARRAVHIMERAGYVPVRNPHAKDGRWHVEGKNVVVYAKSNLSYADQICAVRRLMK